MANIIDGLRKARRHEIIELISLIETYTLSKKTLVSIHKLKTLIQKLLHKNGTVTGMQEEYESIQDKLILLNDSMLQNRFKKNLQREVRATGKFRSGSNDDQLSVFILDSVSSLYGRKQYALMSPAEIADELKLKCQKRNPKNIKRLPSIWFWCTIILLLCILPLSFYFYKIGIDILFSVAIIIPLEIGTWIFFRRMLALEKLAQVVALSGISYGTSFSVQSDELSVCRWSSVEIGKFERGLRALHTLMAHIQELIAGTKRLSQLNEQSEQLRQSNLQSLKQLRSTPVENAMEQEELNHKIQRYLTENARLEDENKQRLETILTAERQIQYSKNLQEGLQKLLSQTICDLWQTRYSSFQFHSEFFKHLVDNFEWFSFEIIERRLLELEQATNPESIGKFRNGHYIFEFAIERQSCALIYDAGRNLKILTIQRNSFPKDVGLLEQQLNETLTEYSLLQKSEVSQKQEHHSKSEHNTVSNLIQEMAVQIKQGRKTIGILNKQVDTLALEKKTIELERKSLLLEKEDLAKKLEQLRAQIHQNGNQNSQELKAKEEQLTKKIADLETRLSEKTAEIKALQTNYNHTYQKALLELEQQKNQTKHFKETIDKNKQEMERLQEEYSSLQQSNDDLTNQLNLNNSTLKIINDTLAKQKKENSEQKNTYEKLKSTSASMRNTIASQNKRMLDIEASKHQLEDENKTIQNSLQTAQKYILEQEKQIEQLSQSLVSKQAQLDSAKIFENADIRLELEKAFSDAQTEIDIISPWIANFINEPLFVNMIQKALQRGVIIKIKYGFSENRGGKDLSRETLKKAIKSDYSASREERSILNIYKLHKKLDKSYPGRIVSYRQDSHAKLLIVDKKYYLIGSFNFLSYDGSTSGRGELAVRDSNQSIITDMYSAYFQFNTNLPKWITESLE